MGKRDIRGGRGRRTVVQLESSKESYLARYGYKIHDGQRLTNLLGEYKDSEEDDSEDDRGSPMVLEQVREPDTEPEATPVPVSEPNVNKAPKTAEVEIDNKVANFLAEIDALDVLPVEPKEKAVNNNHVKEKEEPEISLTQGAGDNQIWTIRLNELPTQASSSLAKSITKSDMSAYRQKWVRGGTEGSKFQQDKDKKESSKEKKADSGYEEVKEEVFNEPVSVWQQCVDENTQYQYYWNTLNNEVTWEIPLEFTQYLLLKNQFDENVAKAKSEGKTFKIISKRSESNKKPSEPPKEKEISGSELSSSTADNLVPQKSEAEISTIKSLEPSSGIEGVATKEIKGRMMQLLRISEMSDSEEDEKEEEKIPRRKEKQDLPDSTEEASKRKKEKEIDMSSKPEQEIDLDFDDFDIDKELEMALEKKKDDKKSGKSEKKSAPSKNTKRLPTSSLVEEMRRYVENKRKEEAKKKAVIEEQLAKELDKAAAATTHRTEEKRKREVTCRPLDEWGEKRPRYMVGSHEEWERDRYPLPDDDYTYDNWELRRMRDKYDDYNVGTMNYLDEYEEGFRRDRPPPPPPEGWRIRHSSHDSRCAEELSGIEDDSQRKIQGPSNDVQSKDNRTDKSKKSKPERKNVDKLSTCPSSTSLVAYGDDNDSSSENEPETVTKLSEEELTERSKELEKKEAELEMKLFKERAEELSGLCVGKLDFLEITTKSLSRLQILLIELQTRHKDWQAGGLDTKYYLSHLKEADSQIQQYEESAAPSGWSCHWDRAFRRYFYLNKSSGKSQWDYPDPESESEVDTTKEDVAGSEEQATEDKKPNAVIDGDNDANTIMVVPADLDEPFALLDKVSSSASSVVNTNKTSIRMDVVADSGSSEVIPWPVHPEEPPPPGTETFLYNSPPPPPPDDTYPGSSKHFNAYDSDSSNGDDDMDIDKKSEGHPADTSGMITSVTSLNTETLSVNAKLYDSQNELFPAQMSDSVIARPPTYIQGNETDSANVISRPPQPAMQAFSQQQETVDIISGVTSQPNASSHTQTSDNGAYQEVEKERKKKKKDKKISGTSLSLKKKNVSSLVMKWQKVKEEVEIEERHREEREMAIRQKLEEWKQEQS